jgi:hypothetical protein
MVTISSFEMKVDDYHRQIERVNRLGWRLETARGSRPPRESGRAMATTHLMAHPGAIATLLLALVVLCATVIV